MVPVFDISRAIGWIKTAAAETIKFVAIKTLLVTLVFTVMPVAMYKGWLFLQEKILTYLNANSSGSWEGTVVTFTGLGGWIADQLRFSECFAVLISGLTFRFVYSFFKR